MIVWGGVGAAVALVAGLGLWFAVRRAGVVDRPEWVAGLERDKLRSEYCMSCHRTFGEAWHGSHHQLANAAVDAHNTLPGFDGQTATTHAAQYAFVVSPDGEVRIEERRTSGALLEHEPAMRIAYDPLQQYLVETEPGRFQVSEVAWDPRAEEWFAVFGDEERNPGEWGHWTGQGMNWNSMCARCHMTAFDKGYDVERDRLASTWVEQGIGCVQCHGPMTGHEDRNTALVSYQTQAEVMPAGPMETCASCHSRSEALTASFPPGEAFSDHFRLQLIDDGRLYFPDGQIRDEVFVWGSFQHSRMGAAGVTCLDCHDSHSGGLRLPVENNALCLQCHQPGGRLDALAIDPVAHSFHPVGSAGNRCVECHMTETTYMQRDPRRDHGFIIPDPVLTRDLGVPNACNKCHTDQTVDWAIAAWKSWYGDAGKHERRRRRARTVARGFEHDPGAVEDLIALIRDEPIPAWRASMLSLAGNVDPENPALADAARDLRGDADPLVRASAVRILGHDEAARPMVREALQDPARLVRLDAAWALSTELASGSEERAELDAYLQNTIEQPVSRFRYAQDLFRRGHEEKAIAEVRVAMSLDPLAAAFPEGLGFMLNAMARPGAAAPEFERAAELAPENAGPAFYAGLAWADAGNVVRAEAMLREAVRRDPGFARAWYNLGLLLDRSGRREAARAALATAEDADDQDPAIPYALATIHAQANRPEAAAAAARRALALDPDHRSARQLLRTLEAR